VIASENRPGSKTFLLVGLVLLVTVGVLVAAFVPLVDCPLDRHKSIGLHAWACPLCGDKEKTTLLRKWAWRPRTPKDWLEVPPEQRPKDWSIRDTYDDKDLYDLLHMVDATKLIIAQVCEALELFKLDHSRYPTKLDDLVKAPAYVDPKRYPPRGYMLKLPKDAWERDLIYRLPGTNNQPYDVISLGRDGKEGGEGFDADIWNHDAYEKK